MTGEWNNKLYVKDENKYTKYLMHLNKKVGIFHLVEDGFWYYSSTKDGGFYTSDKLKQISVILEDLNGKINNILQDYFDNCSKEDNDLDNNGDLEW